MEATTTDNKPPPRTVAEDKLKRLMTAEHCFPATIIAVFICLFAVSTISGESHGSGKVLIGNAAYGSWP